MSRRQILEREKSILASEQKVAKLDADTLTKMTEMFQVLQSSEVFKALGSLPESSILQIKANAADELHDDLEKSQVEHAKAREKIAQLEKQLSSSSSAIEEESGFDRLERLLAGKLVEPAKGIWDPANRVPGTFYLDTNWILPAQVEGRKLLVKAKKNKDVPPSTEIRFFCAENNGAAFESLLPQKEGAASQPLPKLPKNYDIADMTAYIYAGLLDPQALVNLCFDKTHEAMCLQACNAAVLPNMFETRMFMLLMHVAYGGTSGLVPVTVKESDGKENTTLVKSGGVAFAPFSFFQSPYHFLLWCAFLDQSKFAAANVKEFIAKRFDANDDADSQEQFAYIPTVETKDGPEFKALKRVDGIIMELADKLRTHDPKAMVDHVMAIHGLDRPGAGLTAEYELHLTLPEEDPNFVYNTELPEVTSPLLDRLYRMRVSVTSPSSRKDSSSLNMARRNKRKG